MSRPYLSWLTPVRAALILWALVVIAALLARSGAIAALDTLDPDDALRLVQVRDLIGGQGWWDVTQHRINPAGGGGLMHWSRIVDAPLAAIILALRPMLGQHGAEMAASALWPLLLLLPLLLVTVRTGLSLGDRRIAYAAPLLIVANQLILYQYLPLRVDHHGWQILLQGALLLLALSPANARNGALAGLCAAVLILISLEGLPAVTLFAGLFAVHWLWTGDAGARARLSAMLATLAVAAIALQWATRGPDGLVQRWCDGVSLPWLAALSAAAAVVATGAMAVREAVPNHVASRAAILALGGAAALAALLLIAPECRNGPFAALDPLVDQYWYRNVREGLPLFTHWDELVGFSLAPTLVGMVGSMMAWRRSTEAHRASWLMLCAALLGTGVLSLLVMRTASAAHVMAVPGTAWLLIHAWQSARALSRPLPRIAASLACLALFPPTAGAGLGIIIAALSPTVTNNDPPPSAACVDGVSTAPFAAMQPQRLFTPLDIAPHLLQRTPHAVIATGHHRNNAVMAQVIAAFVGPADAAEARVRSTGATMLVICPSAQETANFAKAPGNSLTDDLLAGRTPVWLEPVPLPAGSPLRAWRVR